MSRFCVLLTAVAFTAGARAHPAQANPPGPRDPASMQEVTGAMEMNDTARFAGITIDQLEWRGGTEGSPSWDAEARYGGDLNGLVLRTEGARGGGSAIGASAELMWDRAISEWWNLQAGAREDFGAGPPRTWAAVGVRGTAPYWLQLESTVYAGEGGRTAARIKAEYELFLTQRLVLQPKAELNAYGKQDRARGVGSGLSELELGLRLRYEIRRELAPYVGVDWVRLVASTANMARRMGHDVSDLDIVVGVRLWL